MISELPFGLCGSPWMAHTKARASLRPFSLKAESKPRLIITSCSLADAFHHLTRRAGLFGSSVTFRWGPGSVRPPLHERMNELETICL